MLSDFIVISFNTNVLSFSASAIIWPKYFKGEKFMGFTDLQVTSKIFLHCNSILCFCNPWNVYHKNAESHESTKILILETFRLYGIGIVVETCSKTFKVTTTVYL